MLKRILQPTTQTDDSSFAAEGVDGLDSRLATMLVRNGSGLSIERAILGDPAELNGRKLEILVDAEKLNGVQRALWQTQRCLLPCIATQYQDRSSLRHVTWHVSDKPLAYLAGIRMVSRVGERMLPWCLLVSKQNLGTGPLLPVYLTDMTPREWLDLDGAPAWDYVRSNWQMSSKEATPV